MNKAQAIIHHYGSGKVDFVIRASGKLEWNGPGEKPTDEQIEQWEQERIEFQALESQKQTIIQLVKSVEYHFIPGSRHPDTDGKWKEWVDKLWVIYDSGKIQELPEKPY